MSAPSAPKVRLYRMTDVMRLYQVHRDAAYGLMHSAGAIRIGRSLRVRPEDLDAYLRSLLERSAEVA